MRNDTLCPRDWTFSYMVLFEKNVVNRALWCTLCSAALVRLTAGKRCLWFWGHLGTHQQMSQSQLLCTTSTFIPTVDLKGQDLSLTAIIFKHLN